jgi:hypothetical protein
MLRDDSIQLLPTQAAAPVGGNEVVFHLPFI